MTSAPKAETQEHSFGQKLAKATVHYGLGQTMPKVIRFLLLPIFTLYLTPYDYGVLEISVALGALLGMLMRLGVPGALVRFYFDHQEGQALSDYVTSIAGFILVWSLCVAGVTAAVGPWVLELVYPDYPIDPYFWLVLVGALFTSNYDLQLRLIQARQETALAAKLNIIRAAISISLSLTLVVGFGMGLLGLLVGELTAGAVFLVQALHYLRKNLTGSFQRSLIKPSMQFGMGMLPSHLAGALTPLALYALMGRYLSVEAVGIWAIALRFIRPLELVRNALGTAFFPMYCEIRKAEDTSKYSQIAENALSSCVLCMIMILGAIAVGPPVIKLFFSSSYHEAADLLFIIAPATLPFMIFNFINQETSYQKKTHLLSVSSFATGVCVLGVTWLLAPSFALYGVGAAYFLSEVVRAIALYALGPKSPVTYPIARGIRAFFFAVLLGLACFWLRDAGLLARLLAGVFASFTYLYLLYWVKEPQAIKLVQKIRAKG